MEREVGRVVDTLPGLVWTAFPDGRIDSLNQFWTAYTGLELEASRGSGWQAAVHAEDLPRLLAQWQGIPAARAPVKTDIRLRGTDQRYRWFRFCAQPSFDATGRVVKWCGLATDIDERAQAEEALRASERRSRRIVDGLPVLFSTATADGALEEANRHYLDYFGGTLEELQAREAPHSLHPDDRERVQSVRDAAIEAGRPYEFEVRSRRHDGAYRWFHSRGRPLRDATGRIVRWYNLLIDINERKTAEQELRESERSSRLIVDSIPGQVAVFNAAGEVELVNDQTLKYYGKTLEELKRWGTSDACHPEDLPRAIELFTKSISSGDPFDFEIRARRFDGAYRWFQSRGFPQRDGSGRIVRWYNLLIDIDERKRAEEALHKSQTELREAQRELQLTMDSIPVLVTAFQADGTRIFVNKTWQTYTGLTLQDVTGERQANLRPHFHPDDAGPLARRIDTALASGEPLQYEVRMRGASGEYRWHSFRAVPVRDENGAIIRWYSSGFDIHDRMIAEEALRESEARLAEAERELRFTLDSIPTITWRAGANGYVQKLNKRWFDYTGTTPEQVRGRRWKTCIHPDDLDKLVAIGDRYIATETPVDAEARVRRNDGTYRWFLFRPAAARDETGKVVGWYGTITDIEDRKQAEQKAIEAERELQRMIDHIPVLVATYDAAGERISVNERTLAYTGLSTEDVPGDRWRKAFHPDDVESIESQWNKCLASGEPFEREIRIRAADGTYRWHAMHRMPARDETGKLIRWYGSSHDIEDRKRAEQALAASERNLKLAIDTAPALIWSARPDGAAEEVNQHYLNYVGLPLEQVQGWGWTVAVHPDDLPGLARTWEALLTAGTAGEAEARLRRYDGEYRWFVYRANPLRDDQGNIVRWYGVNLDIEDRRRAEEELRRSEAFLAKGQEASLTGTFSFRTSTGKFIWSEQLYRIYEFLPSVPVTFDLIASRYHPEDRYIVEGIPEQVRKGVTSFDYGHRLVMPDGSTKFIHVVAHGVADKNGTGLEYFGAVQDVTQRRLGEVALDRARSELAHVTRVMSLGALTASIAHEVNQPLAGIITNAGTCLRMLGADPPNIEGARETARRTIRDGNRAADVITRLRALFSKKRAATETVDLNEATREVLSLVFSDLLRGRIVLRAEFDDEYPLLVTGDRVQLQQVILNLVRNASDAMMEVNDRPRQLLVKADRDEEGRARLTVRDVGVGLEPQAVERMFDPFYTTKGDGMGIGLSVSRSIIENHGGKLWAESNVGPGATLRFLIPGQAASGGADTAVWMRPTRGALDLTRNS